VYFAVLGISVGMIVWIIQQRRWSEALRTATAMLLTLILAVAILVLLHGAPVTLGPRVAWYEKAPARELLLFALMVLGMMARYFTKAIEVRRGKIAELRKQSTTVVKPPIEFDTWEFAYPLFVSVVTFGALLSQLKEPAISIASLTMSFQTGFFWQTVLATRESAR